MLPADIARAALHTLLAVLIFTDAQALSGFTFNLAELTGPAIATALVLGRGAAGRSCSMPGPSS